LEGGGLRWHSDLRRDLDPNSALDETLILDRLSQLPTEISVLDVGAGPLTNLGTQIPGRRVEIIAIDPLGNEYARTLADLGLTSPVPTQTCRGEEVRARFGDRRFDIAYSRNALDHAADPVRIIENMLAVTKIGGFVVLRHHDREAERRRYTLLHQWNFGLEDDAPIIWNRRARVSLRDRFGDRARIEACRDRDGTICIVLSRFA
jgi:SAM-dependent methyltransferase